MTIGALPAVQAAAGTGYLSSVQTSQATDGAGFGSALAGAVDNLQALRSVSNTLEVQAVTGNLNDIHAATIASTRAQVTLELVATVRNKGVEAFNEIMRMQA
jgi:flagellar hook-basal body complex protein FliE